MTDLDATMIAEGQWELTAYEPSDENFVRAVQHLIDTGLAWQLQGHFGRLADTMIGEGYCTS